MTLAANLKLIPVIAVTLMCVFLNSCMRTEENTPSNKSVEKNSQTSNKKAWLGDNDSYAIGIEDEKIQTELDNAAIRARETAREASKRWQQANPMQQENWLIKWAAPIKAQESKKNEYVWVKPIEWSPFRVEGILVTSPAGEIGFREGDLVAFPVEELYDWIYKIEGTMDGPRQGGFTVDILEKHFGTPKRGG